MRTQAAVLAAAAFFGLAAGGPVYSQAPAAQPPVTGAVLAGQVIDDIARQPIGGVIVTLSLVNAPARAGGPTTSTRRAGALTNAEGRFVFRDVPPGKFTVTASLTGYASGAVGQVRPAGPSQPVDVSAGARLTNLVVRMWKLSTVSGVVRNDLGEPLVGVNVQVLRRSMRSGQPELTYGSGEATDEQGRYRVSGLSPGAYAIAVLTSTQTNPVATVRQMLQARAAAGPSGRMGPSVTTEGRESGAVQIERTGVEIDGWQASVGIGSPQPIPGPNGTLQIQPPTYYPGVTDATAAGLITLTPGVDRHGLDFVVPLIQGARISGVVIGPAGPAARNAVRLIPYSTDPAALLPPRNAPTATADEQGRFVMLGVPPGTYLLDAYRAPISAATARMLSSMTGEKIEAPASPPPGVHARMPITIGSSHVDGITLTMVTRASVSGRFAFDGAAAVPSGEEARQMAVALIDMQTTARIEARMTAEGTFEMPDVPPGRYHVLGESQARDWRFAGARSNVDDLTAKGLTVSNAAVEGVVVRFTDKTMALTGTVTDESGRPAVDGSVILMPANVKEWMAAGMSAQRTKVVQVAPDGSFQMAVTLPGDYILVAAPPEVDTETLVNPVAVEADVAMAYAARGVKVTLAPGDTKTQALTMRSGR